MVAVVAAVTEQHRLLRVALGADVAHVARQLKPTHASQRGRPVSEEAAVGFGR